MAQFPAATDTIHSRFRLNKQQQTTRIMRAMDKKPASVCASP
jgi:hypothetical protein